MRGYERDEYEDWDEYETDGEEQEEEEGGEDEHEETHQPTQEELDYLALRQKLKETIRKQMKKDLGTTNSGSHIKTNAFRKDNYGSFFGPSQPVIAPRVIQESKTLLENPELAARIAKKTNKSTASAPPVRSKSQSQSQANHHRPSTVNGLKKKVEMLKNTRDYSFLLSDDAEVPTSSKSPPLRNVSTPKSDARSAQLQPRSRPAGNDRSREDRGREPPSNGRKPMLSSSNGKPKDGQEKRVHTGKSVDKQLGSSNGSGPGRPIGPKGGPSKSSVPATGKMSQPIARNAISGDRSRPSSSLVQSGARKPTPSNIQSGVHRPSSSNGHHHPTKRPLAQREYRESSKAKVITKQAVPSSRPPLRRSPPRAQHRPPLRDERPKKAKPKRQLRDEDEDLEDADVSNMIRQMFRYNPKNYRDDDDDSDMEANFHDIMREEHRSAKIARKEDEEELRKIEEEERRGRERLAKRRKLSR